MCPLTFETVSAPMLVGYKSLSDCYLVITLADTLFLRLTFGTKKLGVGLISLYQKLTKKARYQRV